MVDYTNPSWNESDSQNTAPAPNGLATGSSPSAVPGVIRANMGSAKRSFDRINPRCLATNIGNAYTLTYDVPPLQYEVGELFSFIVPAANTGAATININGMPTKAILQNNGSALKAGDLVAGAPVTVTYNGTAFLMSTQYGKPFTPTNMGTGSGLDADLLDGQQGAYYAPIASPTFTGTPAAPTAAVGTNTTQLATTAFVKTATDAVTTATDTALALKAPLASPALTGVPTAPTAAVGTNTTQVATTAFVATAASPLAPAGMIAPFAGSTAPAGWLKADGSLVSRTTYALLFAYIGTTYGAGDGSTTFALPDYRGAFLRGVDSGRGLDPTTGRAVGSYQADAIQDIQGGLNNVMTGSNSSGSGALDYFDTASGVAGTGTSRNYSTIRFRADRVARVADETRPKNYAVLYCIKT